MRVGAARTHTHTRACPCDNRRAHLGPQSRSHAIIICTSSKQPRRRRHRGHTNTRNTIHACTHTCMCAFRTCCTSYTPHTSRKISHASRVFIRRACLIHSYRRQRVSSYECVCVCQLTFCNQFERIIITSIVARLKQLTQNDLKLARQNLARCPVQGVRRQLFRQTLWHLCVRRVRWLFQALDKTQ